MADTPPKSLMHNLGAFFGNVIREATADVNAPTPPAPPATPPQRQILDRQVKEELRDTPQGRMVVRETVVREIEMLPPESPGPNS